MKIPGEVDQKSFGASFNIAKLTYYSSFHCLAIYAIMIWGQCTDAQKVLLKQKSAIRVICRIKQTDSCREVFRREKIFTTTSAFLLAWVCRICPSKTG